MADVFHVAGHIAPERGTRDREIARVARRQRGVIAHEQLVALGLSTSAIQMRVRTGRLHVIHRGVYAVGHPAVPPLGRLWAAVLACGPGAMISHRSAAKLWGLLDDSRSVIDVVAATNRRSRNGIRFHRVRNIHRNDRAEVDGIPVTSLARTLLDLAEVVPLRRLTHALETADRRGVLDLRAIDEVCNRSRGRRGLKPLRAALAAVHPEAKYANPGLERRFLGFCRERDLPDPALNAVVEGLTVDALWQQQRVIVELDSWTYHKGKRAFEEDRRRDAKLKLAGHVVLRVTHAWLEDEPDDLERTLRALLASAPPSLAPTA